MKILPFNKIYIVNYLTLIMLSFIFLFSSNLQAQKKDYNKAILANSIEGFESFLTKHPKSIHYEEIKEKLMKLEYEKLDIYNDTIFKKTNQDSFLFTEFYNSKIAEYTNFLEKYPNSSFYGLVMLKLEKIKTNQKLFEDEFFEKELKEISKIRSLGSIESYANFLNKVKKPLSKTTDSKLDSIILEMRNEYLNLIEKIAFDLIKGNKEKIYDLSKFPFQYFQPENITSAWGSEGINETFNRTNYFGGVLESSTQQFTTKNSLIGTAESSLKPGVQATFYSDIFNRFEFNISKVNGKMTKMEISGSGYIILMNENLEYSFYKNIKSK
ncbi:hypothetical protein KO566_03365 [Flavobacteriaceae bacterium XHP0103]|uniref:hypothetical protein n=1 Tax=Marixanthotalea marina TaxID=2844359 RepID=UPI002989B57E|nr:hypothetical protein [Marixanthotalea marina]MBU3821087.1 hypothetical protein [Marixanthotalea marina]